MGHSERTIHPKRCVPCIQRNRLRPTSRIVTTDSSHAERREGKRAPPRHHWRAEHADGPYVGCWHTERCCRLQIDERPDSTVCKEGAQSQEIFAFCSALVKPFSNVLS